MAKICVTYKFNHTINKVNNKKRCWIYEYFGWL